MVAIASTEPCPHAPETWPLGSVARFADGALELMARLCEVSVENFERRYQ